MSLQLAFDAVEGSASALEQVMFVSNEDLYIGTKDD